MSIYYHVIQRRDPRNPDSEQKYYLSVLRDKVIDFDMMIDEISALSTVNGADVSAVLYGMIEVITKMLSWGHSVQLGGLGTLRVSVSSDPSDTEEEATPTSVRRKRILFRPGRKVNFMLRNLEFTRKETP